MTDLITISSRLAFESTPGLVRHCAAKGAILSFPRALSLQAAPHGARVNAIAPGLVDTTRTRARRPDWRAAIKASLPAGRRGVPADGAATALLRAGKGEDFHVGACLSPIGEEAMH